MQCWPHGVHTSRKYCLIQDCLWLNTLKFFVVSLNFYMYKYTMVHISETTTQAPFLSHTGGVSVQDGLFLTMHHIHKSSIHVAGCESKLKADLGDFTPIISCLPS